VPADTEWVLWEEKIFNVWSECAGTALWSWEVNEMRRDGRNFDWWWSGCGIWIGEFVIELVKIQVGHRSLNIVNLESTGLVQKAYNSLIPVRLGKWVRQHCVRVKHVNAGTAVEVFWHGDDEV
jgi:hypothetical protein